MDSALAHRHCAALDKLSYSEISSSHEEPAFSLISGRLTSSQSMRKRVDIKYVFSGCVDFQTYNGNLLCSKHSPGCWGYHSEENTQKMTFEQQFEEGKGERKAYSREREGKG